MRSGEETPSPRTPRTDHEDDAWPAEPAGDTKSRKSAEARAKVQDSPSTAPTKSSTEAPSSPKSRRRLVKDDDSHYSGTFIEDMTKDAEQQKLEMEEIRARTMCGDRKRRRRRCEV